MIELLSVYVESTLLASDATSAGAEEACCSGTLFFGSSGIQPVITIATAIPTSVDVDRLRKDMGERERISRLYTNMTLQVVIYDSTTV